MCWSTACTSGSTGRPPSRSAARRPRTNLADIAAMGAVPTALLVGLACPPETPMATVRGLADGLWAEAGVVGVGVVGGDLTSAATLVLAVTALGTLEGRAPVTRAGARPGDRWRCAVGSAGRPPGWPCWPAGSGRRSRSSGRTGCRSRPTRPVRRRRGPAPPR